MKFSELIGKTIANTQLMKKNGYDDEAWVRLDFTDGTHCFVVSSYGGYTGKSECDYPAFISLQKEVEGLIPIEET